jgi:hypothetical protein
MYIMIRINFCIFFYQNKVEKDQLISLYKYCKRKTKKYKQYIIYEHCKLKSSRDLKKIYFFWSILIKYFSKIKIFHTLETD